MRHMRTAACATGALIMSTLSIVTFIAAFDRHGLWDITGGIAFAAVLTGWAGRLWGRTRKEWAARRPRPVGSAPSP